MVWGIDASRARWFGAGALTLVLMVTVSGVVDAGAANALRGPSGTPSAADLAEAKKAEDSGGKLAGQKKYQECTDAYEKAYTLAGHPSALRLAAQCHGRADNSVRAHQLYSQLLRLHATGLSARDKTAALGALTLLETKVGKLDFVGSETGVELRVDDTLAGTTPLTEGLRVAAGKHVVTATKDGFEPFTGSIDVGVGATKSVEIELKPKAKTAAAGGPADAGSTPVLDFCQLAPNAGDGTKFVKQRLVMFNLDGADVTQSENEAETNEKGEVIKKDWGILKAASAHEHAREVFHTVFLMPRFYSVVSPTTAPSMAKKASITDDEIQATAGDNKFVQYSLACAEWAGNPRVVTRDGTWSKVKKKKVVEGKEIEYLAWDFNVNFSLELDIYKHDMAAKKWTLLSTLTASNSSLVGSVMGFASGAISFRDVDRSVPGYISKVPDASCSIPAAVDGKSRLTGCSGKPLSFNFEGTPQPNTEQPASSYCKGIDDAVSSDSNKNLAVMKNVATCAARSKMEAAAIIIQKEAKRLEGWKLFSPLIALPEADDDLVRGISMGKDEGAHRGDVYIGVETGADGQKQEVGWGRLVTVGPGGAAGDKDPSHFRLRDGDPKTGTRMEEYAQIGVVLGLQPGVMLSTSKGDVGSGFNYGGGLAGGYNASPWVGVADEFWSRIYVTYFTGKRDTDYGSISTSLFSLDLMPEFVFHGPRRLNYVLGIGGGYTSISVKPEKAVGDNDSFSGATYGVAGAAALEYLFTPDWKFRMSVLYRQNFSSPELEGNKDKAKLIDAASGSSLTAGSASGLRPSLSLDFIF